MTPNQLLRRAEMYVGRTCLPGRFDCVHLALLVQEEVFGRTLPAVPGVRKRHPVDPVAQHDLIESARDSLADPVDRPETGDAVLFKHAVQVRGTYLVEVWHVATLFIDGVDEHWVLHTHDGCGSVVLERLAACRARGLRLDGFYRWKVAAQRPAMLETPQ